jgi:uncharacterized membrane protein YkvA (DUF1232 family)
MGRLTGVIKSRFLRFRRDIIVVAYAVKHPGTPLRLRVAGVALILYLASPFDLVPLFVPFVGLLDDLLIVPWGLSLVVRRLPADTRAEVEASAARFIGRYVARPVRFLVLLLIGLVVIWAALLWLLWRVLLG